ncbi:MAG: hypothetical protein IKA48_00555 [Fibrobacter sp.]|nr:hypothetical protein [Fibrobacter sp.]
MKKLIPLILIAVVAALTGCSTHDEIEHWDDEGRIVRIIEIGKRWDIFCDKSTNIAYLRYWEAKLSGITPYLTSEGKPARCNEVHR